MSLESKFGQKVEERSEKAAALVGRDFVLATAGCSLDCAPVTTLVRLLQPWGLDLDVSDKAALLARYSAGEGVQVHNAHCSGVS